MTEQLTTTTPSTLAPVIPRDKVELVKRTICRGATDDELELFVATANRLGLDPFARQIYAVKRWDKREGREIMTIQVSIDGFRLAASRTHEYQGQVGPLWCGPPREDGSVVWLDAWLGTSPPHAAKVGVWRASFREPLWSVANWSSYAQLDFKSGAPTSMWKKFPALMLGKCAEALSLRRAFPAELSGVYAPEEMAQAEVIDVQAPTTPAQTKRPALVVPQAADNKEQDSMLVLQAAIELADSADNLEHVRERITRAINSGAITKEERAALVPVYRARLAQLSEVA